jgi:ABC-2 type transport system ATP-binding protein
MIEIDALGKTYGRGPRAVRALADVSLSMEPGVWAVAGPNGAGKTTLLGLVLGFLHPTAGAVRIDGETPRRYMRRRGAAYLPERFRLPPEWPVRGALRALARADGQPAGDAAARADAALERMGLADYADRAVGTLSRGLNQRVGLAQTLLAERDLVVLDEPTEGLDPLWRVRFRELVAELRDAGRTVLLASHELGEVERLADRVVLLADGRVRDVMEAAPPTAALRYRLDVDADDDAVRTAFPAAERDGATIVVQVADAHELSHRLAGLLEAGAVVRAVAPAEGLEERVRERLEGPDGAPEDAP